MCGGCDYEYEVAKEHEYEYALKYQYLLPWQEFGSCPGRTNPHAVAHNLDGCMNE